MPPTQAANEAGRYDVKNREVLRNGHFWLSFRGIVETWKPRHRPSELAAIGNGNGVRHAIRARSLRVIPRRRVSDENSAH
jgi:hypothetical protein